MQQEYALAAQIARGVSSLGGRAYYVGGVVRDALLGIPTKDVDIEVFGITPQALRGVLAPIGSVLEKGASFGVLSLVHTHLDIAMPRRESRRGAGHRDFDVSVDPFLGTREAAMRRDFTINAMLRDVLTGEITDHFGGQRDLARRIIRHVNDGTFAEDALRVFRAAQFAARFEATIAPETVALCRTIDARAISRERVFEELSKALLRASHPSMFFSALADMRQLAPFLAPLPAHPPLIDAAAAVRGAAQHPLAFMLAALCHTLPQPIALLKRLTHDTHLSQYVASMASLLPRAPAATPGTPAFATRMLFDGSACVHDLALLLALQAPASAAFWQARLADYLAIASQPRVLGRDLVEAGFTPGPHFAALLDRAKALHYEGIPKAQALACILAQHRAEDA